MAAGVAHELNNPLTTVTGFSELVLEDFPADSPHRRVGTGLAGGAPRQFGRPPPVGFLAPGRTRAHQRRPERNRQRCHRPDAAPAPDQQRQPRS
ncbi:MAG: hypothetical protein HND47_14765 [Chloroflexi bacterium]|nr:hypothetical protein [Chloroflexota bacterium]